MASLAHRGAPAVDGDRYDRRPGLNGHYEAAFLERQQFVGPRPRALREDEKRIAASNRSHRLGNRRPSLLAILSLDRHEAASQEHATKERELEQLRLEQHVQPPVERDEQHGRIDVALMVRKKHHGAIARYLIEPAHLAFNPRED